MEQNQNNENIANRPILSWDFKEFEHQERGKSWYISFVLVVGILLGLAVYQVNFLFAVIIIIAAITFIHTSNKEPRTLTFVLDDKGIYINDIFLSFNSIHSFYLIVNDDIKKLFIEPRSVVKPRLAIELTENQNPQEIKNILLKYIPENKEREQEPLSEILARKLKL